MNQTETINPMENPFSFSGIENFSITLTGDSLFKVEGRRNERMSAMEQPVNNYLKTPEEMAAEFCFVINSRKASIYESDDSNDTYGRLMKNTDGYMNIHSLDEKLSGFMEENY